MAVSDVPKFNRSISMLIETTGNSSSQNNRMTKCNCVNQKSRRIQVDSMQNDYVSGMILYRNQV